MRTPKLVLILLVLLAGLVAGLSMSSQSATAKPSAGQSCSPGYVDAIIDGQEKCLRNGEFCSPGDESQYERYGFTCSNGRLETYSSTPPPTTTSPVTTTSPPTTTNDSQPKASLQLMAEPPPMTAASTFCTPSVSAVGGTATIAWGDGQSQSIDFYAAFTSHTYATGGNYTVTLACTDSVGKSASATANATITGETATTTSAVVTTGAAPPVPVPTSSPAAHVTGRTGVDSTIKLHARTKSSGCRLGALPDRRCSPGGYYSRLTKAVICSSSFRTGSIRNVSSSEKHQVEVEYGMVPKAYGRTLEIDHIVSLELGGSNDIANLYPEKSPGYHVKDKLENKLHTLVCAGAMTLHAAQAGIASNWEKLYTKVFGRTPSPV